MTSHNPSSTRHSESVTANRWWKPAFFVVFLAGLFLCWWLWWPIWFSILGGQYIGWEPSGISYSSTEFEFRYGHATRYVDDPHNHFQWAFGNAPDSIKVKDGHRLIVYNAPGAFLKSWADSIDVEDDTLQHKGYMGIWSEGTRFVVDRHGVVQEDHTTTDE